MNRVKTREPATVADIFDGRGYVKPEYQISVTQAAELLGGISPDTVRRYMREGKLRSQRLTPSPTGRRVTCRAWIWDYLDVCNAKNNDLQD